MKTMKAIAGLCLIQVLAGQSQALNFELFTAGGPMAGLDLAGLQARAVLYRAEAQALRRQTAEARAQLAQTRADLEKKNSELSSKRGEMTTRRSSVQSALEAELERLRVVIEEHRLQQEQIHSFVEGARALKASASAIRHSVDEVRESIEAAKSLTVMITRYPVNRDLWLSAITAVSQDPSLIPSQRQALSSLEAYFRETGRLSKSSLPADVSSRVLSVLQQMTAVVSASFIRQLELNVAQFVSDLESQEAYMIQLSKRLDGLGQELRDLCRILN